MTNDIHCLSKPNGINTKMTWNTRVLYREKSCHAVEEAFGMLSL